MGLPWRLAFANETASMHHERAMTQALRNGDGWQPGFVPTDADLSTFNHPVRMVFGSADPTGSVDLWREFTTRLPHGELEVVEGAGHMPWWDEPGAVGRSVRSSWRGRTPGFGDEPAAWVVDGPSAKHERGNVPGRPGQATSRGEAGIASPGPEPGS